MFYHAFNEWKSWLIITVLIAMSGYGIYLGRILRWNSWGIFIRPVPLLKNVQDTLLTVSSLVMIGLFLILMGINYPFLFYFVALHTRNNAL